MTLMMPYSHDYDANGACYNDDCNHDDDGDDDDKLRLNTDDDDNPRLPHQRCATDGIVHGTAAPPRSSEKHSLRSSAPIQVG
eukprot:1243926-Pyramimonas_sp.AAC.1